MENEIWKDIPGYEGYYQVSNFGLIRSCDRLVVAANGRTRFIKGKMIRSSYNNKGYLITHLCKNGVIQGKCVHHFVALVFLGARPKGMDIDHINEDKTDNRACNLRYMSHHDNASRSTKGKFRKKSHAMECNPRTKVVLGFKEGKLSERIPCAKYLTDMYEINYSTLRHHLQNGGVHLGGKYYCYETSC